MAGRSKAEGGKVKSGMLMSEGSSTRLEGFKQGGWEGAGASEGVAVQRWEEEAQQLIIGC